MSAEMKKMILYEVQPSWEEIEPQISMKIWRKKDELIPGSEKQSLSFNLLRRASSFILAHSRATSIKCTCSALSEG